MTLSNLLKFCSNDILIETVCRVNTKYQVMFRLQFYCLVSIDTKYLTSWTALALVSNSLIS